VLSALGLVAADERRDEVRSRVVPLDEAGALPADAELDLRYAGQSHELTVPAAGDPAEAFHRLHEERYGFADRERPLELVAVRRAEIEPGPPIELRGTARSVVGPATLELPGATCWVPDGWSGETDAHGTLVLRR
jgi:N-methylhydantoinase A